MSDNINNKYFSSLKTAKNMLCEEILNTICPIFQQYFYTEGIKTSFY